MTRRLVTVASLIAITSVALVASAAKFKHLKSGKTDKAWYEAKAPGMDIEGSTTNVKVTDSGDNIRVEVGLVGLPTGIGARDKELQNFLKAKTATLVAAKSGIKQPADGKTTTGKATGTLTLNKKSKDVTFNYSAKRTGSDVHVKGDAAIHLEDYDLKICGMGGIVCVKNDATVYVSFKLRDD